MVNLPPSVTICLASFRQPFSEYAKNIAPRYVSCRLTHPIIVLGNIQQNRKKSGWDARGPFNNEISRSALRTWGYNSNLPQMQQNYWCLSNYFRAEKFDLIAFNRPTRHLTRLPFEVLPTGDGRRLIDEYQISYLGAGRDVLRFGAAVSGQPTADLVAADPDFNLSVAAGQDAASLEQQPQMRGRRSRDLQRGLTTVGRLPGTWAEGERIATMLKVKPCLGKEALEARIKACRSPRILHLATHGFFLEDQPRDPNQEGRGLGALTVQVEGGWGRLAGPGMENPLLRSGLLLAGFNTWFTGGALPAEAEDGILTAEDVSGLDLLATELVVLSACETGLGEVRTGEGVFGLRRAFVLAGAKTLVMSLWKVPDAQTRELMEDFYRRILQGEGRVAALRAAQLAMKEKYPDPYYWGAFICQGEPGPLPLPALV
jgi:hypothetical protein